MSEATYVYLVAAFLIGSAIFIAWLATQSGKEHHRKNIEMQRSIIRDEIAKNFTKGSRN